MTRVLVLGRQGQLAQALAQVTWPTGWHLDLAGRDALDLNQIERIEPFISDRPADIIINTAAYTEVDRAESEVEPAFRLNAEAPEAVADACRASGRLLIHVSTDYVFGGAGEAPYREDDPVAPLNVYGRSKAEGERRVRAADPGATIARTSWLMSPTQGFAQAMLRRVQAGAALRVVADQCGTPTLANDLAQALVRLSADRYSGRGGPGPLHLAGPEAASWHDLAVAMTAAVAPDRVVTPICAREYGAGATRPADSRLDVSRLLSIHGIQLRPWSAWITDLAQSGLIWAANGVETGQQSGG